MLLIAISLAYSGKAFALGGGGRCGTNYESAIAKALRKGIPQDAELAIQHRLDFYEKSLSWVEKAKLGISFTSIKEWRANTRTKLINARLDGDACGKEPFLRIATRFGNVEVARYLLGTNGGSDPNAPKFTSEGKLLDTLFMKCEPPLFAIADRDKYLEALTLALDTKGSDINATNQFGNTALYQCMQPDVIKLYLSRGADPTIGAKLNSESVLDRAVRPAVSFENAKDQTKRIRALELVKAFADAGMTSIVTHKVEDFVRVQCKFDPINEVCKELSNLITASRGVLVD